MPRNRRRTLTIATLAVAAVVTAVALPLFQPWRLFTGKVVDEALPGADPISMTTSSVAPPTISGAGRRTPTAPPPGTPRPATSATSQPTARPTSRPAAPRRLATGELISHEHRTTGTASILELPNGSRVLRLEGLATSDGPDLKVWLSDAKVVDGRAGWQVFDDGRYRSLGELKGTKGNQNYAIPADTDLTALTSISIWCDRFNVSFGAATLA
ncbi:DM13 domain-containing protein [Kribbella sp. CA-293567]|uniref:DM13 domain-containing protein n=1 Tax=Kribbella sp. CA-293567 TaxID=3002436 RepID=UPI0022DE2BFD|nr:DM13 domain-containing protein [Kribbella sp. CA-293567]WBQ02603.1 DM13 domain-containing protein [Kribbella sp. CA-293567]